jgi:hypothetical protein
MFPFAATRGAAGDRRFSWNSPIAISHAALPDRPLTVEYDQSQTVLEVGLVEPSTTLWHLRNSGGLARWPLGHGALTLILATDGCTRPNTAPPTVADVYG